MIRNIPAAMKKKNLIIFGPGPEAIKMAPLVNQFLGDARFETRVCLTGYAQDFRDQVLAFFKITPTYDLSFIQSNQSLYSLTGDIIDGLQPILEEFKPDYVFVNGDTTSSMASSIASFYSGAKVCDIAAGLRAQNKHTPFPAEINRQITGRISDFHFAPTKAYKKNLLQENVQWQDIVVTGNMAIDALLQGVALADTWEDPEIEALKTIVTAAQKLILVTENSRANYGQGFVNLCQALQQLAQDNPGVQIIYPVRLKPHVQKTVALLFEGLPNIQIVAPLDYPAFVWLLNKAHVIITDRADVQEEAPSLGKPVLVLSDIAERPEAVAAGTVLLVGTNTDKIRKETQELLDNPAAYAAMSALQNPYGEGLASQKIIEFISNA